MTHLIYEVKHAKEMSRHFSRLVENYGLEKFTKRFASTHEWDDLIRDATNFYKLKWGNDLDTWCPIEIYFHISYCGTYAEQTNFLLFGGCSHWGNVPTIDIWLCNKKFSQFVNYYNKKALKE